MTTVTLFSAKGSPGVTTVAVGLVLGWAEATGRAALAVDADAIGGDMAAGILRGAVSSSAGMLALATSRTGSASEAVDAASVHLRADGSARVLTGIPDAARVGALTLAWDRIVEARAELEAAGTDLLVDGGRVDLHASAPAWLVETDLALLVVRPTLPAVTAARRLAETWVAPGAPTTGVPLAALVIEAPSPYRATEVAAAVGLPLQGVVPSDPVHARVHSDGVPAARGFARSSYARAMHRLACDLVACGPAARAGRVAEVGA